MTSASGRAKQFQRPSHGRQGGGEARERVTEDGVGEPCSLLAEQRMAREGLEVTLDKGFGAGTYAVYVVFDDLAARVGFGAALRRAREYCGLLKGQLRQTVGHRLGHTEDASRTGDPGRKRDLEASFLSFAIKTDDGQYHDDAMRKDFRLAFLRTDQMWDQAQAKVQDQRRGSRQDRFRRQLAELLDGEAYAQVDGATKERLLSEVPSLAFRPRGMER